MTHIIKEHRVAELFDHMSHQEWVLASEKLEEIYAGELLPSEVKNEYIQRVRERYHNCVIDALVSASSRTCEAGEVELGLWFARTALSIDDTREDVYRVLMYAQARNGQRSEAVETYMTCLRLMRDTFGVDLSEEMVSLYEGLVLNQG